MNVLDPDIYFVCVPKQKNAREYQERLEAKQTNPKHGLLHEESIIRRLRLGVFVRSVAAFRGEAVIGR